MQLNSELLLLAPWIDGSVAEGENKFRVINPSTGRELASVVESNPEHAQRAISVAERVFPLWRDTEPRKRAQILESWATQIDRHLDELAVILTSETGKPLVEARGELSHGASALRWSAQSLLRTHGDTLPIHSPSQRNYTVKQPLGVVACITPWNFPAAAILVKVGAALAAGCTVVVKPSEETPLIALALAKLSSLAQLPPGVFNILPCGTPAHVGDILCNDHRVKMLSFTGSTEVGKKLYSLCAKTVKRVALELGGNAPYIIFDDADIDKAINDLINARFYNSGQICVGANRIFIHQSIYSEFADKFTQRVLSLRLGDGFDPTINVGPMINMAAKKRLIKLVDDALAKGATRLTPNKVLSTDNLFFPPTVLANATDKMHVYVEEIFGPLACLYSFKNDDEVIAAANDTEAGLVGYIYSQNIAKLIYISEKLDVGVVGANSTQVFSEDLPFGGVKQSGLGYEHGLSCLDAFTQSKSICLELNYTK